MKTYFAVTGVVKYNDKMLILKKSMDDRNYPGKWGFCSGFVKEFEAGEDTVLREIREETGLKAEIIKTGEVVKAVDGKNNKVWIVIPFHCKVDSDKISLDHENQEYRWITINEIDDYEFVPGVIQDLKNVGLL